MPTKKSEQCSRCGGRHELPVPRCMRYNGWTNYETWCVGLWVDNDQGSHEYWREAAREQLEEVTAGRESGKLDPPYSSQTIQQQAAGYLAEHLKDSHEEGSAELLKAGRSEASIFADLIGAALSEVNWYEIAEHMIDTAASERAKAS